MRLSLLMLAEARVLTGQIRSLNQRICELEGLIEKERPRLAGHRNLLSSKGIGPVSLRTTGCSRTTSTSFWLPENGPNLNKE
jgi:hypothetical protein